MVGEKFNSPYWQALNEDYEEFKVSHRQTARNRWQFVPGRLISLPGLVLYELEQKGMIECDGHRQYRPRRK